MNSKLVYSTGQGRICPQCGLPAATCKGHKKSVLSGPSDGIVRVRRETKGRKGKCVTCISGIPLHGDQLETFAKQLKQKCGAGGTIKDGIVEIQGDHIELLLAALKDIGYKVR